MKEEQILVHVGAEMKAVPQVKEEKVDVCVSPDMEVETPIKAEVWLPKSESTNDGEQSPFCPAANVSVNQSIDDEWNDDDGSTSPGQSPSIEVTVNLEQPAMDEKKCRFCGKNFRKDSVLMRHVKKSHKGSKAFKCLQCNKEFEQRSHLVQHTKVHTGEKPFKCDFCDRAFSQNSSCIVHMRMHTGEKPYFCKNCGKSFASSSHLKLCKLQSKSKSPAKKVNTEENVPEEKLFSCFGCNKKFRYKYQFIQHVRIHTGEKPYSCEVCGKTFSQISGRNVHRRVHSGEKPYYCEKCGKSFRTEMHLKFCTSKKCKKPFRCETCGKTFRTKSDLEIHFEVHEAWKTHMSKKLQKPELEENKTSNMGENLSDCDTSQPFSEGPSFTLQSIMKEEQILVHVGAEMKAVPQVKEEKVDVCVSPDMEVETPIKAEVWPPKSEATSDGGESPFCPVANVSVNQRIDDEWNDDDGSTSPGQSPSTEVMMNLGQPAMEEKSAVFVANTLGKTLFL